MKRYSILNVLAAIALMLAVSTIGYAANLGQPFHDETNSAESLQISDIHVPANNVTVSPTPPIDADEGLRKACAEAVDELRAARTLLKAQDKELHLQSEMLALERQIISGLKNLRELDAGEKNALREALAAKDRQILATDAALAEAKKNKWTAWKAVKAVTFGVAAGILIGSVFR